MTDDIPAFKPTDGPWTIKGGLVYQVELDRETSDFAHLKGKTIRLYTRDQGVIEATCTNIERFMHCAPWRKGEKIGVWLDAASIVPAGLKDENEDDHSHRQKGGRR